MRSHELSEEALAHTVAVGPRGVEEVAAQANRVVQCLACELVVRAGPACEAPHSVANLAHPPAESAEIPIAHSSVGSPCSSSEIFVPKVSHTVAQLESESSVCFNRRERGDRREAEMKSGDKDIE